MSEEVTVIMIVGFISLATWMTINTILEHRRKMAAIKAGGVANPALEHENAELKETVTLMQDRIAVLEQIAIDPARRTAEEIEKLR